jgi:hypothetical protein
MTTLRGYHLMRQEIAGSEKLMQHIGRKVASMRSLWHSRADRHSAFQSSAYWQERYRQGSNSGSGSYGRLALFKAEIINRFVKDHGIADIIEFGCGDGAQLTLAEYPRYVGVDVSASAVTLCRKMFSGDPGKTFLEAGSEESNAARAEMAMSLDVIYHLVEDDIYETYMRRLERSATRFVCVYSSNVELPGHVPHIRHRRFTDWFARNAPQWALSDHVRNRYSYDVANPTETSWADFYFFERRPAAVTIPLTS